MCHYVASQLATVYTVTLQLHLQYTLCHYVTSYSSYTPCHYVARYSELHCVTMQLHYTLCHYKLYYVYIQSSLLFIITLDTVQIHCVTIYVQLHDPLCHQLYTVQLHRVTMQLHYTLCHYMQLYVYTYSVAALCYYVASQLQYTLCHCMHACSVHFITMQLATVKTCLIYTKYVHLFILWYISHVLDVPVCKSIAFPIDFCMYDKTCNYRILLIARSYYNFNTQNQVNFMCR